MFDIRIWSSSNHKPTYTISSIIYLLKCSKRYMYISLRPSHTNTTNFIHAYYLKIYIINLYIFSYRINIFIKKLFIDFFFYNTDFLPLLNIIIINKPSIHQIFLFNFIQLRVITKNSKSTRFKVVNCQRLPSMSGNYKF